MTSTRTLLIAMGLALAGCPPTPGGDESTLISSEPCDACSGACVIENLATGTPTHHNQPLDYEDVPPVGGPHNQCWGDWAVYDTELEDDHWVHNLEHGGIIYLYDCPGGCEAEETQLREMFDSRPAGTVLVTPYAGLEGGFAAVAWGWRLVSDCFDRATFDAFYDTHVDQAPESVTSGPPASCEEALSD